MQEALINNWRIVHTYLDDEYILIGDVVGHPKLGDQDYVFTSAIKEVNLDDETVTTRNTIYILGPTYYDSAKEHDEAFDILYALSRGEGSEKRRGE